MPPSRSDKGKGRFTSKQSHSKQSSTHVPGVQKVKSSIRQAKRLLAKDNIPADLRLETERRLKALEGDLEAAERSRKERTMVLRYRRVKFFDKQKLCRKIAKTKKLLSSAETRDADRPVLEDTLFSLRVDLNYVLNYPKLEPYIALFPSGEDANADSSSITNTKREAFRERVKAAMRDGTMKSEPETTMEKSQLQENPLKAKTSTGLRSQSRTSGHQTEDVDDFFDDETESNEGEGGDDGGDVSDE